MRRHALKTSIRSVRIEWIREYQFSKGVVWLALVFWMSRKLMFSGCSTCCAWSTQENSSKMEFSAQKFVMSKCFWWTLWTSKSPREITRRTFWTWTNFLCSKCRPHSKDFKSSDLNGLENINFLRMWFHQKLLFLSVLKNQRFLT